MIDHGRITEAGSYDELVARNGAFAELIEDFGGENEAKAEEHDVEEEAAIDPIGEKATSSEPKEAIVKAKPKILMQEEERALGSVSGSSMSRSS